MIDRDGPPGTEDGVADVPLRALDDFAAVTVGGVWILAGSVVAQLLLLASTVYLARRLSADGYGLYALGTTTLVGLVPIADFGLDTALVRFVSLGIARGRRDETFGALVSALVLGMLGTAVSMIVLVAIAPWLSRAVFHDARMNGVLVWTAVVLPALVLLDLCTSAARALGFMVHVAAANVLRGAASLVLVVAISVALRGLTVRAALLSFGAGALVAAVATSIALLYNARALLARPPVLQVKRLFSYSAPVLLYSALYAVLRAGDRYVAGALFSSATTGKYILASTMALYLGIVHVSMVGATLPALADRHHRNEPESLAELFDQVACSVTVLTFPLLLAAVLLWHDVLALIAPAYVVATAPAVLLTVAVYAVTITGPNEGLLLATGEQRREVTNLAVSLPLGIAAELLLASRLGVSGLAIGVVVTVTVFNLLNLWQIARVFRFQPVSPRLARLGLVTAPWLAAAGVLGVRGSALARWTALAVSVAVFVPTFGRAYVTEFLASRGMRAR